MTSAPIWTSQPTLSRRQMLGTGGGAAMLAAAPTLAAKRALKRPNILFVMADDLGYADLSCYGRRDYQTPVIDRLAYEGLLMTQAYASSPICSPTRVALITGRYPQRLPVGLPEPIRTAALDPVGLAPGDAALPRILKAAGYATALIGKWHMGWPPANGPLACGYDRFFGIAAGGADYFTHREVDAPNLDSSGLYDGNALIRQNGYLTDLLADRAIDEIRRAARVRQPFFLSLHLTAPHWPWQGPSDEATSAGIFDMRHADGGSLCTFAAMVRAMDAALGRVLAELDGQRMTDDTLVIFTSDNGGERFSDTWPFRGGKGELLEGGIRVPAIVRWPQRIPRKSRSLQVMATIDWLPTLAAAAGASLAGVAPPDGENLLPVLAGTAPLLPRRLYWRSARSAQAAVRDGDHKYLRIADKSQLYDLAADPRERADLSIREPATLARLKSYFECWNGTMLRS